MERSGTGSGRQEATPRQVEEQLRRILESPNFSKAPRHQDLLRYLVQCKLQGREGELKEYTIAVEVFRRDESFDSRITPLVRVQMGRLRSRLKDYYEQAGSNDPILIELVPGKYAPSFRKQSPKRRRRRPQTQERQKSVAVLPFVNLSSDPEQEYFCAGLTDELVAALTRIEGLRTVAWPAGRGDRLSTDWSALSRDLSVDTVLEGRVRREGTRFRLNARLVSVRDLSYLWSEVYDGEVTELLSVQESLSRSIVNALKLRFVEDDLRPSRGTRVADLETYNAYLQARYLSSRRSREGLQRAAERFRFVVDRDPGFADAWCGMAEANILLGWYGWSDPRIVMPAAKQSAEKGLEANPSSASAHAMLALALELFDWRWEESERHFLEALERGQQNATVLCEYGLFQCRRNRIQEGLELIGEAAALDSLSPAAVCNLGVALYYRGDFDAAAHEYRAALAMDERYHPAHYRLGQTLMRTDQLALADRHLSLASAYSGELAMVEALRGCLHMKRGNPAGAKETLSRLVARSRKEYGPHVAKALILASLGDPTRSVAELKDGIESRDPQLVDVFVDPFLVQFANQPGLVNIFPSAAHRTTGR